MHETESVKSLFEIKLQAPRIFLLLMSNYFKKHIFMAASVIYVQ